MSKRMTLDEALDTIENDVAHGIIKGRILRLQSIADDEAFLREEYLSLLRVNRKLREENDEKELRNENIGLWRV